MTTLPPPDAMEWTLGASAIVPSFKGCTFIISASGGAVNGPDED
jgi:hypothetical protein